MRIKPQAILFGPIIVGLVAVAALLALLYAEGWLPPLHRAANSATWSRDAAQGQVNPETESCSDPARLPGNPPTLDGNPPNYLLACGGSLFDSRGKRAQITGVSWFGFETDSLAPHGLHKRNWKSLLDQIATLGFNTVRLPYTNDILRPGAQPKNIDYRLNPDLEGLSSLGLLDRIIQGARERGLKVILDRHRPESWGQSPLWHTDRVSEKQWIDDWRSLAARYLGNDTVIGFDLHNEPKDHATWGTGDEDTDWRLAAERAGNAILAANPYLLIFVQGVQWSGWDPYWWGGSLRSAKKHPVQLAVPGRLVYSPHDYGPGVYPQPWFWDADFPANLEAMWDEHWGFLKKSGIAPVVVGEFGGRSIGSDREGIWQRYLVDYMRRNDIGYLHWSLNPDSSDTGGLLSDDWEGIVVERMQLVTSHLAPPLLADVLQHFGQPVGRVRVHYRNRDPATTREIHFALRIENDSPRGVDLAELEVRYWLNTSELSAQELRAEASIAPASKDDVQADIVDTATRGERYLKMTFGPDTGVIPPYQMSGEISVRVEVEDDVSSEFDQLNDYSYAASAVFQPSERITLYRGGELTWGKEPSGAAAPDQAPLATQPDVAQSSRPSPPAEPFQDSPKTNYALPTYRLPPRVVNHTFLAGVEEPSAMAFAPDGRLFYAERRTGRIRIVENGRLAPTPFYDFAVSGQPHTGLLGLALHPDFARNHYVYVFYTAATEPIDGRGRGANRVVRLTEVNGRGVDLATIVDDLPSDFIYTWDWVRATTSGHRATWAHQEERSCATTLTEPCREITLW